MSNEQRKKLEQWLCESYSNVASAAYNEYPNLHYTNHEDIMNELAAALPDFRVRTAESFERKAATFVTEKAKRYRLTETILRDQRKVIFAAIHRANGSLAQDVAIDAEDLFNEISSLVFQHIDSLSTPGAASLSTRIFALAKLHTSYGQRKRTRRHKLVTALVDGSGVMTGQLPAEELAEMKAAALSTE